MPEERVGNFRRTEGSAVPANGRLGPAAAGQGVSFRREESESGGIEKIRRVDGDNMPAEGTYESRSDISRRYPGICTLANQEL